MLSNAWNAVFPRTTSVQNAMPVKGETFFRISDAVLDGDIDAVTPISNDGRTRELSIDEHNMPFNAIWCLDVTLDYKMIVSCLVGDRKVVIRIV